MQVDMKEIGKALSSNIAFIDFMRVLHSVTGFSTVIPENGDTSKLERYNGKRQVYADIIHLLQLPPETRGKIEYHATEIREE